MKPQGQGPALSATLLACLYLGCASLTQKGEPVIWTGTYEQPVWEKAFHPEWGPDHVGRDEIVTDEQLKTHVLRVKYPQGGVGPQQSGLQYLCRFGRNGFAFSDDAEHLFIRYWLKFESEADFSKGGKLPGLAGNTDPRKNPKTGGGGAPKDDSEGFSVRVMWREDGKLAQYVYHPGQLGNYGDYYWWELNGQPAKLELGRWHCLVTEVKLNTEGKKDALIRSWLDGQQVLEKKNIALRNTEDCKINVYTFDTFYGGAEPDWAPKVDSYVRFGPVTLSNQMLEPEFKLP